MRFASDGMTPLRADDITAAAEGQRQLSTVTEPRKSSPTKRLIKMNKASRMKRLNPMIISFTCFYLQSDVREAKFYKDETSLCVQSNDLWGAAGNYGIS